MLDQGLGIAVAHGAGDELEVVHEPQGGVEPAFELGRCNLQRRDR